MGGINNADGYTALHCATTCPRTCPVLGLPIRKQETEEVPGSAYVPHLISNVGKARSGESMKHQGNAFALDAETAQHEGDLSSEGSRGTTSL
jgi:hypothetical protein